MTKDYSDIINLPHKTSTKHPRMSRENRASQFAPFAALVGYDQVLTETRRLTDDQILLSDDAIEEINEKLKKIEKDISSHPLTEITHFEKDSKKQGGEYTKTTKKIKKIDTIEQKIIFDDNTFVLIPNIIDINLINPKE